MPAHDRIANERLIVGWKLADDVEDLPVIAENYRTDLCLVVHLGFELLSETIVDDQRNTHDESGGDLRRMPVDNDEKPNAPFAKAIVGSVEADDGRVGPGTVRSDKGKHDRDTAPEGSGGKTGVLARSCPKRQSNASPTRPPAPTSAPMRSARDMTAVPSGRPLGMRPGTVGPEIAC